MIEQYDDVREKDHSSTTVNDDHSVHLSTRDVFALSYLSLDYDINISGSFKHLEKQHERQRSKTNNLQLPYSVNHQRLALLGRERTESDVDSMKKIREQNMKNDNPNVLGSSTKSLPGAIIASQFSHNRFPQDGHIPYKQSPLVKNYLRESLNSSDCDIDIVEVKEKNKLKLFDPTPLKDVRFTALCISIGLLTLSFQASYVFLPSLAIEKGLSEIQGTYLVSITGALELMGSISTGFVLDLECVRPHRLNIYTLALLVMGVLTMAMPYLHYFALYAVVCGIYGYVLGLCLAQKPTFVIEVVGIEQLVSAFGLLVWFQGLGTLIGPTLSGM